LARIEGCNCPPIVIESSPCDAGLDAARLQSVVALLQQFVPGAGKESVVIGDPQPRGLGGEEAVKIYQNLLQDIKSPCKNSSGAAATPVGVLLAPNGTDQ
jgi:hypothetical protein